MAKILLLYSTFAASTFKISTFTDSTLHLTPVIIRVDEKASEADSLNKKVWAQTELWGKSVLDVKIAFFKKSLVLAGTKLSMGLA